MSHQNLFSQQKKMTDVREILVRKNLPHVITIYDQSHEETLDFSHPEQINIQDVIKGVSELNNQGIVLLSCGIHPGTSKEGITKLKVDTQKLGLFLNNTWVVSSSLQIDDDYDLPEHEYIPFKSDSWILGEFIVQHKTGKSIPKKFLKSQTLLDKFCGDDEKLKKLIVLNPDIRARASDLVPESNDSSISCTLM